MKIIKLVKTLKIAMEGDDVYEGVRFYDPRTSLGSHSGKLVKRKYHQTNVWMMLYDDGTIEVLTNGDLKRIELESINGNEGR